jgi:death on curing protein
LAELTAAYAFGISKNHLFIDNNKRAALLALVTVLGSNSIDISLPTERRRC